MRQKINVGAALTLRAVLPARAFILNSLKTSRMRATDCRTFTLSAACLPTVNPADAKKSQLSTVTVFLRIETRHHTC
jgi:hypothetical protein